MIYFIIGLIVGIFIMTSGVLTLKVGTLRIDRISSDKDVYRFEIDNLDKLSNRKYILMKVDPNADLSQN